VSSSCPGRWAVLRAQAERGSVLVEVVFLLVLLTIPVFYLVGTLGRLQAGAYAVSAAAREAGRAYVTAPDQGSAPARAVTAAGLVHASHGFEGPELVIECADPPCLQPGAQVTFRTSLQLELPLIPDFAAGVVPTTVEVTSSHVEVVDEFREP